MIKLFQDMVNVFVYMVDLVVVVNDNFKKYMDIPDITLDILGK